MKLEAPETKFQSFEGSQICIPLGIKTQTPVPSSIRPPRSAFNFFYKKEVKPLQQSPLIPHFSFIDAAFHLTSRWYQLSDQEKAYYQNLAKQDSLRYDKEVNQFLMKKEGLNKREIKAGRKESLKDEK